MQVEPRIPYTWGARTGELEQELGCDIELPDADQVMLRAVDVAAPPATVFRWLCQLRIAPYSYDWIDNGGRRSPRTLTRGLEDLELGQPFMRIFELVAFDYGRELTLRMRDPRALRAFGHVAITYCVRPAPNGRSRLLAKLAVRYPRGLSGKLGRALLPAGDLLMMRKQLLTLARHAERTARAKKRPRRRTFCP